MHLSQSDDVLCHVARNSHQPWLVPGDTTQRLNLALVEVLLLLPLDCVLQGKRKVPLKYLQHVTWL